MVVMKGLAITAGSSFNFFATMGSTQPINFAQITVRQSVSATTRATFVLTPGVLRRSPSIRIILTKHAIAREAPQML